MARVLRVSVFSRCFLDFSIVKPVYVCVLVLSYMCLITIANHHHTAAALLRIVVQLVDDCESASIKAQWKNRLASEIIHTLLDVGCLADCGEMDALLNTCSAVAVVVVAVVVVVVAAVGCECVGVGVGMPVYFLRLLLAVHY
jgi:hypothetical protein